MYDIIVKKDLQLLKSQVKRHIYLKNEDDFTNLLNLAKDILGWRSLFTLRHIERRSLRKR